MGKSKGFYLDFSPPPFPDEKEAEKNLASEEEIEKVKQHFKLADPKTGLTYAQVAAKHIPLPTVVEEKEKPSELDIQRFREKNPWIVINNNVIQELNPLDTSNEHFELPPVESLFNIK